MSEIPEEKSVGPANGPKLPFPATWLLFGSGIVLVIATTTAYFNCFSVPFLFDDNRAILENPSIRRLWPLGEVLAPAQAGGVTASGRPLVNLSLAINYAIGGTDVRSYHALNLLIHLTAGLVLFGVIRRTLRQPVLAKRFGPMAISIGIAAAALWALHPLQTESVTYIAQRAEALMGLCYLLTLYTFIRAVESARPGLWFGLAWVACLLGMATKEVMISAPVIVFLYDRTFVAGTFQEAWRRRKWIHGALAATGLVLVWSVLHTRQRGGTAGFGLGVSSWEYLLTQCWAITHYLRLSFWPHPLVFDYGEGIVKNLADVWPQAVFLTALATGTAVAIWRWPVGGFLGAWFFAILAPSSSIVPIISQTAAEHRMYLSLAAVVVLAVTGLNAFFGRAAPILCLLLAVVLGAVTFRRNAEYRSAQEFWAGVSLRQPSNWRPYCKLGGIFEGKTMFPEAIANYEKALLLLPQNHVLRPETLNALGNVLLTMGRPGQSIPHFEQAIAMDADLVEAHYNLGLALLRTGRLAEALARFQVALRLKPDFLEAQLQLGLALMQAGRTGEAMVHFQEAVRLNPDAAEAQHDLGLALAGADRTAEALIHFEQAVRLNPDNAKAELHWALVLALDGRDAEARPHFDRALSLEPDSVYIHHTYGRALASAGRLDEAVRQFQTVLRLNPDQAEAHLDLSNALRQLGRVEEAEEHHRRAIQLDPGLAGGK